MVNKPHPGELVREGMYGVGWNPDRMATQLGCDYGALLYPLDGMSGMTSNVALALENLDRGSAAHWVRMQASYDLAQRLRARVQALPNRRRHKSAENGGGGV